MANKEIRIKFLGEDSWGRKVYQNIETKRLYKNLESSNFPGLHTTDSFDGEPDMPLRKDLKVILVSEKELPFGKSGLYLEDSLLDGFSFRELVETVASNEKEVNEASVKKVFNEIVESQINNAQRLLKYHLTETLQAINKSR